MRLLGARLAAQGSSALTGERRAHRAPSHCPVGSSSPLPKPPHSTALDRLGSAPGRCFNDLHWFDLSTMCWVPQHSASKSPAQRSGHCACAVDETMYIFGGNTTKSSFNDLWEFHVPSVTWRQIKTTGTPPRCTCLPPATRAPPCRPAALGAPWGAWVVPVVPCRPPSKPQPSLLHRAGKSPSGRVGHTITALGARLLVLGGREYATNYFDCHLHSFDVRTRHWSQVPLHTSSPRGGPPPQRTGHCTTVHAGRLLLFGGLREDGRFLDDITTVELIS